MSICGKLRMEKAGRVVLELFTICYSSVLMVKFVASCNPESYSLTPQKRFFFKDKTKNKFILIFHYTCLALQTFTSVHFHDNAPRNKTQ